MNSVQDIIAEMNKEPVKSEFVSNEWLNFDKLVQQEDCKLCNGTGKIVVDTVNESRGYAIYDEIVVKNEKGELEYKNVIKQRCDCVLKRIARETFVKRIKESGLQTQLETKTFKTFKVSNEKQKAILDKCIAFSNKPTNMLAMLGQTGAGKTHLGTAIVGNLVYKGYSASYVEWQNEMNIARDDYYKVKQSKMDEWKSVDVLYIDDLFKNKDNDTNLIASSEFNIAWDILDHRLKRNMITILSSEFTIEEIIALDEGTGGRINEMAGEYLLPIDKDPDMNYRLKNIR